MDRIKFSWDDQKGADNKKKHKVSFEEALTIFYDSNAVEFYDPEHSESEDRFLMLGLGWRLRILVVSYCLLGNGSEIRIISARRATKKERGVYSGDKK